MRGDPQWNESERVQPSTDEKFTLIPIDLTAARRNKSSFLYDDERYNDNIDRNLSGFTEMQQFIVADRRKSLEETRKNKQTKQPNNWSQSSMSSSRGHHKSNDSDCCCCCCISISDSHQHHESASNQHDYNDKCCENCCECAYCEDFCECGSCGDCGGCDGDCLGACLGAVCLSCFMCGE